METPIPRNLIAGELQVFAGYNYGDLFRWRIEGEEFIAVPVDSEVDLPEFRAKLYRTPAERTTFGPPLKKWAQDLHAAWALINERRVTHAKEIAQSVEAQRIATERRNQVRFRRAIEGWFKDQPNHVAGLRRIRDREVFIDDFGDCITDGWREKLREYVQKKMPVRDLLPEGFSTTMTYVNEVVDEVVTELIGEPTPSPILSAPGKALEESCESIARAAGFEIARRGGPGDQGADLVLVCGPRRVVIQCKFRDGSSVSNGAVQEVAAARAFYDAQHAIVVSNAVFTTSARQLARRLDVTLAAEAELQDVLMSLFRPA